VQPLLPRTDRLAFEALSCAARDSVSRMAWWLGDPLLGEPGNERRAEHYARLVRVELHAEFDFNEHWWLKERLGGDAVRTMLVRYGWPTLTVYGGDSIDAPHSGYLGADAIPPYSAPEYSPDRVATLPSFDAMKDPLTVQDSDFVLTARDSAVLIGVAGRLRHRALEPLAGQPAEAALVLSPAPDSVLTVATSRLTIGRTFLVQARIPSGSYVGGVEVPALPRRLGAARSRFGVVAPPSLRAMRADDLAVSSPVLFDPASVAAMGTPEVEEIFDHMHATLDLERVPAIGVYWESYGFRAGDTVSVTVQAERVTPVGAMRRIGMALKVADDPNGRVSARWTEPNPARTSRVVPAIIPTLSRQIVLNIANFREGTYRLRVTMQRPGQPPATGERFFRLTR
jgi:hypothetical protein